MVLENCRPGSDKDFLADAAADEDADDVVVGVALMEEASAGDEVVAAGEDVVE
jgi:hypothetical protein